jgi:uncharacterized protein YndB with AHSA1/START domain
MSTVTDASAHEDGGFTLEMRRTFKAGRDRVFAAFTKPETLAQWWGPPGCTAPRVDLDLASGGAFAIDMHHSNGNINYLSGVYDEISPPEKLAFTWAWGQGEDKGPATHVTLEFIEVSEGTEIILTHRGFGDEENRDLHGQGWDGCFACLVEFIDL